MTTTDPGESHRNAIALALENGWEKDFNYREGATLLSKGRWPHEREIVLYEHGTFFLVKAGEEWCDGQISHPEDRLLFVGFVLHDELEVARAHLWNALGNLEDCMEWAPEVENIFESINTLAVRLAEMTGEPASTKPRDGTTRVVT